MTPAWAGRLFAIALAVAVVAVGAGLFLKLSPALIAGPSDAPSIAPVPSTSPSPSPSETPSATETARAGALIAFTRTTDKPNKGNNCGYGAGPTCPIARLWIVGSDGSNAHELFPDGLGYQSFAGWSPDGARLLYMDNGKLYLTDARGSEPQLVDTGCVTPCDSDGYPDFSSDGRHLVFVRTSTDASGAPGPTVIATMDLASGEVTELGSTAPGGGMLPRWSPDGMQIVFWRGGEKDMGGPIVPTPSGVFVVDADGRNLLQVSPKTLASESASWSPDGSRIVFTSPNAQGQDVYTVRPDGAGLRRLTTDGVSGRASWTPDGRILFARGSGNAGNGGAPAFWTMDADGANAAQLIPGMLVGDEDPWWTQGPVWQPVGGPAIVAPPWTPSTATSVGPPPPTPAATPAPALSPGFSWTGSMHGTDGDPTAETATLLPDGRVLVTKGCSATAELYDPATGTFSPTGSLTETRSSKTATLLRDGRVLIVGGNNCGDAGQDVIWTSAERYDPATGTFSPTGSMSAARSSHSATLLADGRVLITGGKTALSPAASLSVVLASYRTAATGVDDVLASAELYDPATGTFSKTGSMSVFRDGHTATLLQDGRVLVVGGGGEGYDSRTEVELYDPATGTFSPTGSVKTGRDGHTATLLRDGRVLIAGGRSSQEGTTYTSAEVYDPSSGKFSPAGSMKAGRQSHTATLLQDGRVLLAGGYQNNDGSRWDVLASTELWDPGTGKFTPNGSMGAARMNHTATLLADGRVLIAGGDGIGKAGLVSLTSAVLYQP